ncbi:MAG: helix-turn-helix domain-containing protein [Acidobacteriota bacterium]
MNRIRKTINKGRKSTGRWANLVTQLRRRIDGVDQNGEPVCTQAELAGYLGVSSITISRWELGRQDPPPQARARLALMAEALGTGTDLAIAFRAGQEQESVLRKTDVSIIGLLRCLFLARESWMTKQDGEELHRLAKGIFDLARAVAADALTSDVVAGPNRLLVDEMVRLLKQIDQDEQSPLGQMARLFGGRTYTEKGDTK